MPWVSISGKVVEENGVLTYTPSQITDGPNQGQLAVGFTRSDIAFENGQIQLEVKLTDRTARCQIVLNDTGSHSVLVGLNVGNAPYGIAAQNRFNNSLEYLDQGGEGSQLPLNEWIPIKIIVRGSRIELYINNVITSGGNYKIVRSPLSLFIHSVSEVQVRNIIVDYKKPTAFIVMQFSEEFNNLYNAVIKPTCVGKGFECIRADDIYSTGMLLTDIVKSIEESTVIIADITPNNPNVFYEVGYAHAIKKPTILMSDRKRDKLPFDVSGFRTLFYDNSIGGKDVVQKSLEKHLESILLGR